MTPVTAAHPPPAVSAVLARMAAVQTRLAAPGFAAVLERAATGGPAAAAPSSATGRPGAAVVGPSILSAGARPAVSQESATDEPAPAWSDALPPAGRRWAPAIDAAARRAGVDPRLFAAVVWSESGFAADATSPAGARGLAQLMPATAREIGVDPDDPLQNLDGGARYLRQQLDRFGDARLAVAAYNAGPGRVARAGGVPDIPETRAYVPRVLDRYARLQVSS